MLRAFHHAFLMMAPILTGLAIGTASAQSITDRVSRARGGTESGEISEMTRTEITVQKRPTGTAKVPINEIKNVVFGNEPIELTQARTRAASGGFAEAVDLLAKIKPPDLNRDLVKQEVEFLQAYSAAQLALAGRGTINDAGSRLNAWVRAYPQNYNYWKAVEAMGDLLSADGKHEPALRQYNELAKAPWPDFKMRAAAAIGRSLQLQGKHADAIKHFDAALAGPADTPDAKNHRLAATLGKAASQAETGDLKSAVAAIEQVIRDADPEQKELNARAYNALGGCFERAGKTEDALLAYLHVDFFYRAVPEAHAEALSHLAPLFQAIGEEGQARDARQMLKERYAGSRWAKER